MDGAGQMAKRFGDGVVVTATLLMTPPFSTTPSAPNSTQSTRSMVYPIADSGMRVTSVIPILSSSSATLWLPQRETFVELSTHARTSKSARVWAWRTRAIQACPP